MPVSPPSRSENKKLTQILLWQPNIGQYAPTTQTIYNIQYDEKKATLDQDHEQQKAKMRGHHHDFKEQNNLLMTSKYNDDFNK